MKLGAWKSGLWETLPKPTLYPHHPAKQQGQQCEDGALGSSLGGPPVWGKVPGGLSVFPGLGEVKQSLLPCCLQTGITLLWEGAEEREQLQAECLYYSICQKDF